jgi:hypothetical protein
LIVLSGADVLSAADKVALDGRLFRIALTLDERQIISSCIEANDPAALEEAVKFFEITDSDLPRLLDDPFIPKSTEATGTPYWRSRFSNGDHPVFYGALEKETAGQEYAHHAPKRFAPIMGQFEIRLHLIACRVIAEAHDLRPLVAAYPELLAESYDFCNQVGAAALARMVESLLARSVRRAGGTNVPVFQRKCLSEPEQVADVFFQIDAVARKASFSVR